jgi:glyoxylase-like metal-dependent hydrolase (beta-lactamase superfamily II)
MSVRIDHTTASGTFSIDGETYDVDNNVWVLGDDETCVVFDAPHDVDAVLKLVGDRECLGILLTHAHDDHVRFAPELSTALEAPLLLNPADREVWQLTHGDLPWDDDVADGDVFTLGGSAGEDADDDGSGDDHNGTSEDGEDAGVDIEAIATPGHSPGSTCYYVPALGCLFSGDTLFEGGPGATGRSFSSRETIEESIRTRLFTLPDETVVHTGHGPDTTIGAEKENARGDWA